LVVIKFTCLIGLGYWFAHRIYYPTEGRNEQTEEHVWWRLISFALKASCVQGDVGIRFDIFYVQGDVGPGISCNTAIMLKRVDLMLKTIWSCASIS